MFSSGWQQQVSPPIQRKLTQAGIEGCESDGVVLPTGG